MASELEVGGLTTSGNLEVNGSTHKIYRAVNSGNPEFHLGSSATNTLAIQSVYTGSAQTLNYVGFTTSSALSSADAGQFIFSPDGVTKVNINDAGLTCAGEITCTGINISSQTDTAATGAARTSGKLDHYEEGTWTPVIRDLAGNVATCSTADGSFTRIGNRVLIGFNVQLSSIGSMIGSYVLIAGIPFNHLASAHNGTGTIDYFTNFNTSYSGLSLDTSSTASLLWLTGTAAGGGAGQVYVPVSAISGDERIKGGAQYHV